MGGFKQTKEQHVAMLTEAIHRKGAAHPRQSVEMRKRRIVVRERAILPVVIIVITIVPFFLIMRKARARPHAHISILLIVKS